MAFKVTMVQTKRKNACVITVIQDVGESEHVLFAVIQDVGKSEHVLFAQDRLTLGHITT